MKGTSTRTDAMAILRKMRQENGKRWIACLGVGWRGAPRVTRQQRPALTGETRSR